MQRIELEAFPDRDERSGGAPTVPRLDSDHPQSIRSIDSMTALGNRLGSRVRIMQSMQIPAAGATPLHARTAAVLQNAECRIHL